MTKILIIALAVTGVLAIIACKYRNDSCKKNCTFENIGSSADRAVDKASEKTKEGVDKVKETWKDTKEDVKEGAENVKEEAHYFKGISTCLL